MGGSMVAGYPHRIGGHCGSGSLRDLLDWAGLSYGDAPMGEGAVFGLGGSLSFSYLRGPGLGTPIYLVGRGAALTEQFSANLGIAQELRSTDDPVLGWEWVRDELDAGRPVLCWAEMAELPYLRVKMRMSRHDIVVIGYDDDAGTVVVVDNDRAEPQTIGRDDLARARSAVGFPVPTRHTCFRLGFPDALPDLRAAAARACAEAVHGMSDPAAAMGATAVAGTAGVAAFVADLDLWAEQFPGDALDRALFSLQVFVEKAGTGGGLFRRLQAEFLTDLGGWVHDPAVFAAAAVYRRLADTWSRTASAAVGGAPASDRLAAVRREAAALPALECEGVERLAALAQRLAP
ncbi:BtrH N-terminal domain-containing protein [Pseudonocardia oceani]|uniref:BtrH N-terminal domain-containing protein n=2 Tax=Pseudonocardia oceani TaxID=2792013 RepID=A0ABS6U2G2_9PSEU|nr:BtrH N-terminal domain-containing protein [Pseudonocardia oceani]MBW0126427.1 BtrH N-terminal domain-containing protein [Pseudonocardia oceani]